MVFDTHWHESAMDLHVFPIPIPASPPSPSHPSGSSQCTRPEHLSHASNLGWWSVSPLRVYLFQCCSLRTIHPCLLPQSPKVCSVHLCLFFYFAYEVIITIFKKKRWWLFILQCLILHTHCIEVSNCYKEKLWHRRSDSSQSADGLFPISWI